MLKFRNKIFKFSNTQIMFFVNLSFFKFLVNNRNLYYYKNK